ncbi:MAG TPA: tetratricopeptide repeat protein, partial [Humisphaera sp.]|nr:tetratricopeptide repeat protein [Humisphaera sp.]
LNQRTAWDGQRQFEADEIAHAVAAKNGKLSDPVVIRGLLNQQWSMITGTAGLKIPTESTRALWDAYVADLAAGGVIDVDTEGRTHGIYTSGKKDAEAAEFLTSYIQLLQKRTPEQRLLGLAAVFHWSNLPADKAGQPPIPNSRRSVILKTMKPLYEQIGPRDFDIMVIPGNAILEVGQMAGAIVPTAKGTDPQVAAAVAARKKEALQLGRVWMKMIDAGARNDAPANYWFGIAQANFQDAIAADDAKAITEAVAQYGEIISRENITDSTYSTNIAPVLKTLDDRNADESEYVFVAAIQHGKPIDTVSRQLMLAKAKSATRIAGLIPVPATDASYDLYVASAALMGGDESKAWELTAPKLNLLKANWEGFDARYVAWAVEQMRKQKLLKESLEFAFNILLRENDLDAETAGHVLLTQSDVYKDMENYQAARLGYEGLKNNLRYAKTEAGQKAVYRLIELHILTKDYTAAETLLERMVDADDVKKQAEAYYLYAEMAFQQAQYKEAKDYLKKVKDRVANHVEAALLEGELNLILPGGLANTEVAIGDPRLSTVVIPGRYLMLQLQDPNLSVARGGAAIPVIVTTSKGGDVEHVKLIPSSANKSLFTARIATALGHAVKDNLTLELIGDDVVSYEIDPVFQKANDLHYPPKVLEVRSDGRLVASSGEILSVEEEEKRELERQLQRREVIESRRLDVGRDGHTIRPGSPIYVQVTDPDQDLTDAPDTVKVDLRTTSGETLEGFSLTETGPHTGVFRGAVPTGIPQPRALASDSDDNRDPNSVIRPVAANVLGGGWVSLSDGHKNKWLEVDTMGSHEVSSVTMEIPHLDSVKDIALLGMLADDYDELASLPARTDGAKGGVQIQVAPLHAGDTIELMRRHLKLAATDTFDQEAPALIRESLPLKDKGDSWQTMHLRGTFWLTENKSLELAYMQPYAGYAERCYVLIDGQIVLDHFNQQTAQVSARVDLAKGPHTMEILCDENHHKAQVIVGFRQPDGTLAALPSEWFSTKSHPELLEYLRPKGKISIAGDILTATFDKPVRLRKVRAMFRDFTGTAIAVKHVTITDAAGKVIVPVPPEAAAKGVLSIAPGDQVAVTYNDVKRLYGGSKTLGASLNSSYFNGKISLAEEIITANPNNPTEKVTEYLPAKRCRAGDQLMIVVTDYDEDATDARDTVAVKVTTSSGETLTLKALETYVNHADEWNNHAGQFLAILKFGAATKGDTIKVAPGDKITVSYLDRENTNPGIPIERTYSVTEAGAEAPRLTVYRTSVKMIPDESPEAKAKLKRIAGRETKGAVLYKPLTVARHPDYVLPVPATQPATERKEVVASVDAPLLFEVTYPRRALNSGSVLEVTAVAESELQAAAKEKREPVVLKVPTYIQPIDKLAQIKGYPLELKTAMRRDGADMLKAGSFSGVIRLQVGSKGDPIDDLVLNGEFISEAQRLNDPAGLYYKVATLLVSGSDTVHIRVKDESNGKVVDTPIRLLSDARLDLLDPSYMIAEEAIHLGEKFHIRVTDADHDTTGERDTVMVKAVSSSGSQAILTLNETLPHSGVFTATLEPQ